MKTLLSGVALRNSATLLLGASMLFAFGSVLVPRTAPSAIDDKEQQAAAEQGSRSDRFAGRKKSETRSVDLVRLP